MLLLDNHVTTLIALGLLAVFVGVVLPAVWSRKPSRRRDALAVLDRIFGRHQPPPAT